MKSLVTSIAIALSCGQEPGIKMRQTSTVYPAKYVTCYDGDTCSFVITLENDLREIGFDLERQSVLRWSTSVRLCGINTPELGDVKAKEAKAAVNAWLGAARSVSVQAFGLDKYGRVLGRVWADGVDLNKKLVAEGLAAPYMECK